jgi:predicted Zn finger-like uncharacterized protein
MNVTCHNCKTKLNIPNDKIPKDKESTFKCPKCREKIQIPALNQQNPVKEKTSQNFQYSFEERQNALVCIGNDALKNNVYPIIRQMGFNAEVLADTRSALNKMEYHIYHLVIVDDAFDQNLGITGILDRMNAIDMSLRRRICLVWISSKFNTNDDMAALHSSVNSVVHINDALYLEAFLLKVLLEHKNFYTVYNGSLELIRRA